MKLSLIKIPYDSGQFNKRMGCGPMHLTDEGLVNWLSSRGHEVKLFDVHLSDKFMSEVEASIYIQNQVKKIVDLTTKDGFLPIILAGNCNYAAFGTICSLQVLSTGILWFDAHGDFNTPETSNSGFFDGMALSIITGNSWRGLSKSMVDFKSVPEEQVVLIGARELDEEEKILLERSKILRINIEDIRNKSEEIINNSIFHLLSKRVEYIYLHIDLDVLDELDLKANQYPVPNGLKLAELIKILSYVKGIFKIGAVSFTAYDPSCDLQNRANNVIHSLLTCLLE
jgi:arginase